MPSSDHSQENTLLPPEFFQRDPVLCARDLIGKALVNQECLGRIIETEAYREVGDSACHLFTRPSVRAFAAQHGPGTAYVHLNYGIHWLINVLCHDPKTEHYGCVLFRALEPIAGIEQMKVRRGKTDLRHLCSGPGKLTAALGIDGSYNGRSLLESASFALVEMDSKEPHEIIADRRIGISSAKDFEWRFLLRDHPGVSVKAGRAR